MSLTTSVAEAMEQYASLLCTTEGTVQPDAFRTYLQRAEALEVTLSTRMSVPSLQQQQPPLPSSDTPSLASTAPPVATTHKTSAPQPFPPTWFYWLALVYVNVNAPIMAQCSLGRLAAAYEAEGKPPTDDDAARLLWSAANHHRRHHYDTAFDHIRRAEESASKASEADLSAAPAHVLLTTTALFQHTLDCVAVRMYCSQRAIEYGDEDTPECLESTAALLNISATELKARLARWTNIDAALEKRCGTVLNSYGQPWSPYDNFTEGGDERGATLTTDTFVRMAVQDAAVGVLRGGG